MLSLSTPTAVIAVAMQYLWGHRNASLRTWLVDEFVLNAKTGLGNSNVDGFYLDDAWSTRASPVPPWAPPTYRQCSMAAGGECLS